MHTAPYGTWHSDISAEQVASNSKTFQHIVGDGEYIYNVEMRPQQQGRCVIVRYAKDGSHEDVLPMPFSARTRVHEYGGRSFTVNNGVIYFVNYADQNLYVMTSDSPPQQITSNGLRFAELIYCKHGIIAVAEQHNADKSVSNFIALINVSNGEISTLVSGDDFYAFPVLNNDESKLAWISWNHPNMPWDSTKLSVANMSELLSTSNNTDHVKQVLENSVEQSFYQPEWIDDENLIFITDYNGWWNFYIWQSKNDMTFPLQYKNAEFAKPLWNLGVKTWGFIEDKIACIYIEDGTSKLALFDHKSTDRTLHTYQLPFSNIDNLTLHNGNLYFVASSALHPAALIQCSLDGNYKSLSASAEVSMAKESISVPLSISFPAPNLTKVAYAYFYPPTNNQYTAPENSKPPLIVYVHGGPTGTAIDAYHLEKQFWTSRGFAVVDVNYAGSGGFGREYRKALQRSDKSHAGNWGEADVKDCIACVEYLISQNMVDPNCIVTRGRSAGGFTTLALLAASKLFKAGACYYGVTDILEMAHDTHKFESHYMEQLVGSLPKFEALYKQRSPINNLDKINVPLLVLQGDEDQVVVPAQSEKLVAALRLRGIPVDYKLYSGEQHGFRKAETIIDALNRELNFYLSVLYPDLVIEKKNINKLSFA